MNPDRGRIGDKSCSGARRSEGSEATKNASHLRKQVRGDLSG